MRNSIIIAAAVGLVHPVAAQPVHFGAPQVGEVTGITAVPKAIPKKEGLVVEINGLSVTARPSGSGSAAVFLPVAKTGLLSGRTVDVTIAYAVSSTGWTEGRVVAIVNGFLLSRRLPRPPIEGSTVERMSVSLNGELVRTYGGVRVDFVAQALARGKGRLTLEPRTLTVMVK